MAKRGIAIRVTGLVQGVGFRPTVWRLANALSLSGGVRNEGDAVVIEAWGDDPARLVRSLRDGVPPLARIDDIVMEPLAGEPPNGFEIAPSRDGTSRRGVVPDAATCAACLDETMNPGSRRFRYPFTNCTHCGPRFSILTAIPYDRRNTSMADFAMCAACAAEYEDPRDRRFHAQPIACPACGPQITLAPALSEGDVATAFARLIADGRIVAIKSLGGFHLACDATSEPVVARLRARKRREAKPLALMARDLDVIARFATLDATTRALLASPAAPIVILETAGARESVARSVAPESRELGFMLPSTPLHALLFEHLDRPVVMTSGNHSGAPPAIDDDDARARLDGIADCFVTHDRRIEDRVEGSVVRVIAGAPRGVRRARGYAPSSLPVPAGFAGSPPILAMGAELKSTFCLLKDDVAILSQHLGDLEDPTSLADYHHHLDLYARLYAHAPEIIAVDHHPDYASRVAGLALATERGLVVSEVLHHHAHVAACLFEHGVPLDTAPVLSVVLDGLGQGEHGALWGGEFLASTYDRCERIGAFKPVALLGGDRAMREPWRNTLAHLCAAFDWRKIETRVAGLALGRFFADKPVDKLRAVLAQPDFAPLCSSAGRLFDAVAGAVGLCRASVSFEGQAAMALEAIADPATLAAGDSASAYPFSIARVDHLPYIEPRPMWDALLDDLARETDASIISARFHNGLADAIVAMVETVAGRVPMDESTEGPTFSTVVLSGGVFQNRILAERVSVALEMRGLAVLLPRLIPVNDGGIALGQAAVASARARKP